MGYGLKFYVEFRVQTVELDEARGPCVTLKGVLSIHVSLRSERWCNKTWKQWPGEVGSPVANLVCCVRVIKQEECKLLPLGLVKAGFDGPQCGLLDSDCI